MGLGKWVGETIDSKVRKYQVEILSLSAAAAAAIATENYFMPEIRHAIYNLSEPLLAEDFQQDFYNNIPWIWRFFETSVLGAPFVRQMKKRWFPERRKQKWSQTGYTKGIFKKTWSLSQLKFNPKLYINSLIVHFHANAVKEAQRLRPIGGLRKGEMPDLRKKQCCI